MGGSQLRVVLFLLFSEMVCISSRHSAVWISVLENAKNDMGVVVTWHSYSYVHCFSAIPEVK